MSDPAEEENKNLVDRVVKTLNLGYYDFPTQNYGSQCINYDEIAANVVSQFDSRFNQLTQTQNTAFQNVNQLFQQQQQQINDVIQKVVDTTQKVDGILSKSQQKLINKKIKLDNLRKLIDEYTVEDPRGYLHALHWNKIVHEKYPDIRQNKVKNLMEELNYDSDRIYHLGRQTHYTNIRFKDEIQNQLTQQIAHQQKLNDFRDVPVMKQSPVVKSPSSQLSPTQDPGFLSPGPQSGSPRSVIRNLPTLNSFH